jgi:putative hydrolase of the HAD superfamily
MMARVRAGPVRYEAVLFDFFGTLVEYQPDRVRLEYPKSHRLLSSWGHSLTHQTFVTQWDLASADLELRAAASFEEFTMADAALAFSRTCGLQLSPDRCQELGSTFVTEWQQHIRPIDGVTDLLARLARSARLGIVSNTHDTAMVPSILRSMGVADRFEVIVLSVSHGYRKPHPSIYRAALDHLGCPADKVAFVGDSYDADFIGAERAGMASYLIDPGAVHDVPSAVRLASVLNAEERLAG